MFTAAEFALIARRHMHVYGTKPEPLATVAATIRNNGHVNPEAVYYGRGPFTAEDILDSRMVADPYHLLDCAMTSEGGCALVLTRPTVATDLAKQPVYILGGNTDHFGPSYQHPPELRARRQQATRPGQRLGRAAGRRGRLRACRDWDRPTSTCASSTTRSRSRSSASSRRSGSASEGEGGDFVMDGTIEAGGRYPITTDGGLMSFSHGGATVQLLQRVIRGVQQLRGECATRQVDGAEVAMCSSGGAGALFTDVLLLGTERP